MSGKESRLEESDASIASYLRDKLTICRDEKKDKLRSWLGKIFKIIITDGRCLVGRFICTDRDGNTILEHTWEYKDANDSNDVKVIGLTLVPIRHIVTMYVMKNI